VIERLIQQVDWTPEHPDGESTVINAENVLTLCPSCGNRLDSKALREVLTAQKGALVRVPDSRIPN